MVWSHPDISMEDLLNLIKGFVDILILASGYQSSGHIAHWDPHNIKKLFQWGFFFENVFKLFRCSDDYRNSILELDAALSQMKSNPQFPQGLSHLSSVTLGKARKFALEYLTRALPLREPHLRALMIAIVEMEFDELRSTENEDCLQVYLENLLLFDTSLGSANGISGSIKDSLLSSPEIVVNKNVEDCGDGGLTKFAVEELMRRKSGVSSISSAENALDGLLKIIKHSYWNESEDGSFDNQLQHARAPVMGEPVLEYVSWNHWKTRNLSYLLDSRTIRLVSGANMIFLAPKIQWVQVFERLIISAETSNDVLLEVIELLLLGCVASRWSSIIEHFTSVSYDSRAISNQYEEVCKLLRGRFQNLHFKEETIHSKENAILEYLEVLLGRHLHHLWKLSPVLAAVTIPSWSQMFRMYLSELESQYKGDSSTIRSQSYLVVVAAAFEKRSSIKTVMFGCFCNHIKFSSGSQFSRSLLEKFVNMVKLKRESGRRIGCSGSGVSTIGVRRRDPVECCHMSYFLKQLVRRLGLRWKQSPRWRRSTAQYSYDPHSYSQNFDDGFFVDHLSPFAPR